MGQWDEELTGLGTGYVYLSVDEAAAERVVTEGGLVAAVTVSVGGMSLIDRLGFDRVGTYGDAIGVQRLEDLAGMTDEQLGATLRSLLEHACEGRHR